MKIAVEGGSPVLILQVLHLAGDEPQAAGRKRQFFHQQAHGIALRRLALGHERERLRHQRVAREHGDAFAEHFVVGRTTAAQVVVVHARQIVVDERVGVNAFDGTG